MHAKGAIQTSSFVDPLTVIATKIKGYFKDHLSLWIILENFITTRLIFGYEKSTRACRGRSLLVQYFYSESFVNLPIIANERQQVGQNGG